MSSSKQQILSLQQKICHACYEVDHKNILKRCSGCRLIIFVMQHVSALPGVPIKATCNAIKAHMSIVSAIETPLSSSATETNVLAALGTHLAPVLKTWKAGFVLPPKGKDVANTDDFGVITDRLLLSDFRDKSNGPILYQFDIKNEEIRCDMIKLSKKLGFHVQLTKTGYYARITL